MKGGKSYEGKGSKEFKGKGSKGVIGKYLNRVSREN